MPVSKIVNHLRTLLQGGERENMRVSKVHNVDVVANAGSIRRRIISSVYRDEGPSALGNGQYQWNQVRLRIVGFAQMGCCSGSIEVPQGYVPELVSMIISRKNSFHKEFGPAVGICGLLRMALVNWHTNRLAIGCTCRRKDESTHSRVQQRIQQRDTLFHVVFKVESGVGDGLADVC